MSKQLVEQGMRDAQYELIAAAKHLRLVVHYQPAGDSIDALYHTRHAIAATQTFFERLEEEAEDEDEE